MNIKIEQKINQERLRVLFRNGKKGNLSVIALSLVIIFFMYIKENDHFYLFCWFVLLYCAIFFRFFIISYSIKKKLPVNTSIRLFAVSSLFLSAAFVSSCWLPHVFDSANTLTLFTASYIGIISIAINSLAMDRISQIGYITMFPLMYGTRVLFLETDEFNYLMRMCFLYAVIMLFFAKNISDDFLQNLRRRFEYEVLAEDMEKAKKIAEEANQSKSTFLANMSHEIRTPMHAIIGLTDMSLKTEVTDYQKKLLTDVQNSSNNLLSLLNDILDFSKIEANQLSIQKQPFKLLALSDSVLNSMKVISDKKKITLTFNNDFDPETWLNADDLRIQQVIINLISNAIKFTDKGEITCKISCIPLSEQDSQLDFSVTDQGIGMTKEQLSVIFNSFQQADNSIVRKYGGTGLGLTISHQLIELMGGNLKVTSILDKGSHFYFSLNIDNHQGLTKTIKTWHKNQTKLDILLVEDDQINQFIAEAMLIEQGHKVKIAENGLICLNTLLMHQYDVILMDIQMPVLDGYSTAEIIRISEDELYKGNKISADLAQSLHQVLKNKKLTIFALTAHAMTEDKEKCLKIGFNDYLTKPFEVNKIIESLNTQVPHA